MQDEQIVDLYWARSENAITETANKYEKYLHYISFHILHNEEDSKECINDTYLKAWEIIPPNRPNKLSTFLGKIVRNISLNKYKSYTAKKRGQGQIPLILTELQECIPSKDHLDSFVDNLVLTETLNSFLATLPEESRNIFVRRYWFLNSIKEIANDFSISESKVKISLMRSRNKLKELLQKEGIFL